MPANAHRSSWHCPQRPSCLLDIWRRSRDSHGSSSKLSGQANLGTMILRAKDRSQPQVFGYTAAPAVKGDGWLPPEQLMMELLAGSAVPVLTPAGPKRRHVAS